MIENKKGVEYTVSENVLLDEDITDIRMSDYDDSFFFVLSLNTYGSEFDWFNNPYIAANVYEFDSATYTA